MSDQSIKSYCQSCQSWTNHDIMYTTTRRIDEIHYSEVTHYAVISCNGCENISFKKDYSNSEDYYTDEEGNIEYKISTKTYPYYIEKYKLPGDLYCLPNTIRTVYTESIKALASDCRILAGAGFRAVVEAICLDNNIKGRNLEGKINNLVKDGLITKREGERLHSIRFLGNDSIHEMKTPNLEQIRAVLNIIDHLLLNLYIFDYNFGYILEKPISEFDKFLDLLHDKIKIQSIGYEFCIIDILGKDIRRVKDSLLIFESELKDRIKSGSYARLDLSSIKPYHQAKNPVQFYLVKDISGLDCFPF